VHAAIGPGIGKCCYEVGAEVAAQFGESGPAHIDLVETNRRQLIEAGVPESADLRGEPMHQMRSRRFPLVPPRQRAGRPHALLHRRGSDCNCIPARAYIISMRAVLFLAAACTLTAAQDPREIVRRSVQLMDHNLAIARNYTFLERSETRELDSARM
jgi:hypothetical protein